MTMTQHTAGPWQGQGSNGKFPDSDWHADSDRHGKTMFAPIVDANGETVALVVRTDWNDAQIEADARLIAASPELLAVLEHASHINGFREFNDYLPTIRAAIAKATGSKA